MFYPVPFDKIVAEVCKDAKLRRLVKNMIYDGVLSKLLNIDLAQMEQALRRQLGKKLKAIELNMARARGRVRATPSSTCRSAIRTGSSRWTRRPGMILVEGNAAAALGCMMAGVTVVAWYPITPSSSLPETLIGYMKKYRMDKRPGKATFAIVQAEDEIAAIGMVIGAGWAGARAMTSTSGPGISLMGEFAGLAYYAEVPGVVFDIQRVGPSTGPADAHRAGRHPVDGAALARRHEAHHAAPGVGRRVLHDGDGRLRPGRAPPDAGVRDERSRPRR